MTMVKPSPTRWNNPIIKPITMLIQSISIVKVINKPIAPPTNSVILSKNLNIMTSYFNFFIKK